MCARVRVCVCVRARVLPLRIGQFLREKRGIERGLSLAIEFNLLWKTSHQPSKRHPDLSPSKAPSSMGGRGT